MSLHLVKDSVNVDVTGKTVTITLPFELPPQFTDALKKKLEEVTAAEKVIITKEDITKKEEASVTQSKR
jgi:hypothetical protein